MNHAKTIALVKRVLGSWDERYVCGDTSLGESIHSLGPFYGDFLIESVERLFNVIEKEGYESPLFVFDNQVFMGFIIMEFRGIQIEVVEPTGKEGLLLGYPFFCHDSLFPIRDEAFIGVVDRGVVPKGTHIHFDINR